MKQLSRSPTRTLRVRPVLLTALHTAQRFFHGGVRRLNPLGLVISIPRRQKAAIDTLLESLPKSGLVWGGDWNHALTGSESAGSKGGRQHLRSAIQILNLQVPTADLLHQLGDGYYSIDHIAVPCGWVVQSAARIPTSGLSDHDAYVIEI